VYRVLVKISDGKRAMRRTRRRWEDNNKADPQEGVCGGIDCTELAQDRDSQRELGYAVMNLQVPQNAGNFLTSCKPVSFSRRSK
jgi:hypothetical protein